jgi:exosortase
MSRSLEPASFLPASDARRTLRGLRPLAALAAVAAAAWPSLVNLAEGPWTTFGYSHGWLIVVVVAWLSWRAGRALEATSVDVVPALAGLAASLVLLLLGRFAAIDLVVEVAAVGVALAVALAWFGREGLVRLAFPFLYLLLAVPVWDAVTPLLQAMTVAANRVALGVLGIPALVEGNLVTVPAGTFEIAGGCSGHHLFVVAAAAGLLYCHLNEVGLVRGAKIVAFALALGVLTNWIRVATIIVRGEMTDMQTPLIHDHYWFGWYLFAGAMVLFFGMLRWRSAAWPEPVVRAPVPRPGTRPALLGAAMSLALVLGTAAYATVRERALAGAPMPGALPAGQGGWSGPDGLPADWRSGFSGPASRIHGAYSAGAQGVEVERVAYGYEGRGSKLIGFGSGIAPEGTALLADGPADGGLRRALVRGATGERWVVRYAYFVGPTVLTGSRDVKLREGLRAFGALVPAGALSVAAACQPDCAAADRVTAAFLRAQGEGWPAAAAAGVPGRRP